MQNIRTKSGVISDIDIGKSYFSAKLIVLFVTALKSGISIEDISAYSKELAYSYDIEDDFYNSCILCALNLINSRNNFSKIIIKRDPLNVREPQHFSKWILNGDDEFARKR